MTLGELPTVLWCLLCVATSVLLIGAWRDAGTCWTLAPYRQRTDGELRWRLHRETGSPFVRRQGFANCRLLPGGHRLATHVILRFADADGRTLDVTVWRGAATAAQFSRVHALLAWRLEPAVPCATLQRSSRHGPTP